MYAHEMHACEMHAHDMHAHEMHAHKMHAYETRAYCCAQQTGMHILVVEALLVAIYSTGDEQILIHKRKPCRSRTCLVRIAGPCPAVPVQLVPAQLGLSPAGPYQLWCTSLRIATDTRPTRNKSGISTPFQIQGLCRSSSSTRPNMTADTLRVATLRSLNYMLSMLHLDLKPSLDIEAFEDP